MPVTNVKVPVTTIFRNAREFSNLPVKILEKMAVKFSALPVTIFDNMPVKMQKVPVTKFKKSRVTGEKKNTEVHYASGTIIGCASPQNETSEWHYSWVR